MSKHIKLKFLLIFFICIFFFSTIYANETLSLYSKNAILVDNDSGKLLFGKGENDKVYPASTTKVLTAILALENLDLSSSTVVSQTAVNLPYGSSNAALKAGEVMSIKDLLYAMMIVSGNDCANALAEAVSGSIDKFVILMNEKLEELGCNNSHFTNPHGYHDDNHYTTPSDMMKILSYAMKNEEFLKIFSTKEYVIEKTNKTETKREYQNTNRLILTKDDSYLSRYYEYCVGGKTGYTDEAGRCLIAYAKKDNKNIIIGVFNSSPSSSIDLRYTDAINLFDYGFDNFEKSKILDKKDYCFSYTDYNSKLVYNYSIADDIYALMPKDSYGDINAISYNIYLDYDKLNKYNINSSDYSNQVIGTIKITFRQNSSTYDKDFDLKLNSISKTPISIKSVNTKYIIIFVSILCLIIISIYKKKKSRSRIKSNSRNYSNLKRLNNSSNINYNSRRRK